MHYSNNPEEGSNSIQITLIQQTVQYLHYSKTGTSERETEE